MTQNTINNNPVIPISHEYLQVLPYNVVEWSSYSAEYHPRNILINSPKDQSSRWASNSASSKQQYLLLCLEAPLALVQTITFGKFHKVHVCNLKEFKIFGGCSPDNLTELLHSGLRNDTEPETFPLKHRSPTSNLPVPIKYLKIVPLAAWGANFNFSIWFVSLRGTSEPKLINIISRELQLYKDSVVHRLIVKHYLNRNKEFNTFFKDQQFFNPLCLEHEMIRALRLSILPSSEYNLEEKHTLATVTSLFEPAPACNLLEQVFCSNPKIFSSYARSKPYQPKWTRLNSNSADSSIYPKPRGGHQMIIAESSIYLHGGWDGNEDIDDFWTYDLNTKEWSRLISHGPSPRSCHKLVWHKNRKCIYLLGKYLDIESRNMSQLLLSDFWCWDLETKTWSLVSSDTKSDGGPDLIYDHQMIVDNDCDTIWVFGGRKVTPAGNSDVVYSGLYKYVIGSNQWKLIRDDFMQPDESPSFKSRIGHSMVFHQEKRSIIIFAGQRYKDYLSDFYIYNVDTDTVTEMSIDTYREGGPEPGFTQRACLDECSNELFILSGLMKEKASSTETAKNTFWAFDFLKTQDNWNLVYSNEKNDPVYWDKMACVEPCPRFAHQLVYDNISRVHYLFGGNPGDSGNPRHRLNDFWKLELLRPSGEDILRSSLFMLHRQRFLELAFAGKYEEALFYLQNPIVNFVNHNDENESLCFRNLTMHLFSSEYVSNNNNSDIARIMEQRNEVFRNILEFFPADMKIPKENLTDFVQ